MRRPHRLIAAALLVAFSGVLGGCSSGFGGGFDPSDLLDFLDTKKKLPGDRKPVFPDGVPGMTQGVPKELYKGNAQQQQQQQQEAAVVAAPPPAEEPASAKRSAKSKTRGKPAAVSAAPAQDPQDPDAAAPEEEGATAVPPAPKPKKM